MPPYQAPGALTGKVALVTGAARGIGKAIAVELARCGADLVIASRTMDPKETIPGSIRETTEAIAALGRNVLPVRADVSDEAEIDALVRQSVERFGRVDILVNNAGYTGRAWYHDIWQLSARDWSRQVAVNLTAPFLLTRALAPQMRALGGGRILNVTSGSAGVGDANIIPAPPPDRVIARAAEAAAVGMTYSTTKTALNRFTLLVAEQLRPANIAAITLDPGPTRTEIWDIATQRDNPLQPSLQAHAIEVPVKAALYLLTCDDPFVYAGKVVVAAGFAAQQRLLDR